MNQVILKDHKTNEIIQKVFIQFLPRVGEQIAIFEKPNVKNYYTVQQIVHRSSEFSVGALTVVFVTKQSHV